MGEVAAVGVADEDYGQRLRAFVVRTGEVSEDDLREHMKANLARFKVPKKVVFGNLPTTAIYDPRRALEAGPPDTADFIHIPAAFSAL